MSDLSRMIGAATLAFALMMQPVQATTQTIMFRVYNATASTVRAYTTLQQNGGSTLLCGGDVSRAYPCTLKVDPRGEITVVAEIVKNGLVFAVVSLSGEARTMENVTVHSTNGGGYAISETAPG